MPIDLIPMRGLKAEGIPLSSATIWRRVRDGSFPRPVYPTPGRATWVKAELEAWKAELLNARDGEG